MTRKQLLEKIIDNIDDENVDVKLDLSINENGEITAYRVMSADGYNLTIYVLSYLCQIIKVNNDGSKFMDMFIIDSDDNEELYFSLLFAINKIMDVSLESNWIPMV